MDSVSMLAAYRVFWKLIRDNCPILHDNMVENEATANMLIHPWFTTLFANCFEVGTVAPLWYEIFLYG